MAGNISDQTTVLSNISLEGAGGLRSTAVWASSLSMGGNNFPLSIYTAQFSIVAQVVQGSASSFTVVGTVTSVKQGDILVPCLAGGAGVSSLSSGLVYHSHCTQNGQFEFRYSNVSTLVQNQTAQVYNLAIIRAI